MTVHVIVGLKRLDDVKQRLSPALDARTRRWLMTAMLRHVLDIARRSDVGPVWLATSEPSAPTLVADSGAGIVDDAGLPWNDGLVLVRDAVAMPRDAVLYLAGDLPLVRVADIHAIAATPVGSAVVARARDGGSNALVVNPAGAMEPVFGVPQSSEQHALRAHQAGLAVRIADIDGLALDVDTADDLRDAGFDVSETGRVPPGG